MEIVYNLLITQYEADLEEHNTHLEHSRTTWGITNKVELEHGVCVIYKSGLWVFLDQKSQADVRLDLKQLLRALVQ